MTVSRVTGTGSVLQRTRSPSARSAVQAATEGLRQRESSEHVFSRLQVGHMSTCAPRWCQGQQTARQLEPASHPPPALLPLLPIILSAPSTASSLASSLAFTASLDSSILLSHSLVSLLPSQQQRVGQPPDELLYLILRVPTALVLVPLASASILFVLTLSPTEVRGR